MDRIERAMRMVEARIKDSDKASSEDEIEYKGLLSRVKKKEGAREKDDIDRVADYVKEIRKAKEAILNGNKKSK